MISEMVLRRGLEGAENADAPVEQRERKTDMYGVQFQVLNQVDW